jgi:hypothetical protein
MAMNEIEWRLIDPAATAPLAIGDLVSAEAGGLPVYEVLSIGDGRVWLRDQQGGRDHIMPTGALHWTLQHRR